MKTLSGLICIIILNLIFLLRSNAQIGPGTNYNFRSSLLSPSSFTVSDNLICQGESTQYLDQSINNPIAWEWTFPGGIPITSNLQNPIVTYSAAGEYNAILDLTYPGGVKYGDYLIHAVIVDACTEIYKNSNEASVSVFPNPAQSFLNIISRNESSYIVSSLSGEIIATGFIKENEVHQLEINDYASGVYFVTIKTNYGVSHFRILKE